MSKTIRKYRKEWENDDEFKGWISEAPSKLNRPGHAYCKWCYKTLRPHKDTISKHGDSQDHIQRGASMISKVQRSLASCGISKGTNETKINDIKLVLHAAVHGTINSLDHLGELLSKCGKRSALEKTQLHRTKASKLICNVIAPAFLKELIDDIGDHDYSIILDESTDVSTNKFMAYCVRYFSFEHKKFVTDFLGFSQVTGTKAEELNVVFRQFISDIGLKLVNLIGIGTDGAPNLCGNNHSLYTLLKEDLPNLQLIKCTCHAIDKCADYAADELPSNLLFMLKETSNWFANSGQRIALYNDYYSSRHEGRLPLKFLSLSATRWLVVYSANSIILNQYDDLRGFFDNVCQSPDFRKSYTAKILAAMYNDHANHLYLTFLDSSLKDLYSLNLAFQKQNADVTKLYSDLRIILVSMARRVFKPSFLKNLIEPSSITSLMLHQNDLDAVQRAIENADEQFGCSLLPLNSIDFGRKFDIEVTKKQTVPQGEKQLISTTSLNEIKNRAAKFIVRLCKEIKNRLPQNLSVIENTRYFSPLVCLSQTYISVSNLPWELAGNNVSEENVENQWRQLQTLRLIDISPNIDASVDSSDFWIAVWEMKNVNGERAFGDLAKFALRALCLPISNAGVERVFSIMAAVKTKIRNRMQMLMLVALIRIRMHMRVLGKCCTSYDPGEDMLKLFNKDMYDNNALTAATTSTTPDFSVESDLLETFESFVEAANNFEKEDYQ